MREVSSEGIGNASAVEYSRRQEWEDNSVVMLLPTRGMVRIEVWRAHDRLLWPMNQKRVKFDAVGMEVGDAYEHLMDTTLAHPMCNQWPWVLTYEEDNVPEPAAFFKLLTAIRHCPDCKVPIGNARECPDGHRAYDGLGALYWTKNKPPSPMAFGHPSKHRDFSVQNVLPYLEAEDELDQIIEVNAIAMGFSLYRMDLFRNVSKPWFKTADPELDFAGENRGAIGQDLWLAIKAKAEYGSRFGVHCGVRCGHIDPRTGETY